MKARRFDLWPEDFLAGVVGELTAEDLGLYLMVILLCYCRGGSIPDDADWLRSKFRTSRGFRAEYVRKQIERLIAAGKVERVGRELSVRRVRVELELSMRRIRVAQECGKSGGRPPKNINGIEKGSGSLARVSNSISNSNNPPTPPTGGSLTKDFGEFWLAYPHKVGKAAAETKYRIARKASTQAELLDGIRRYVETKPADHNWCNPATWLNQRRWEDQPASQLGLQLNGHGQTGPPPAPIDPRKIGHSLPCACSNCSRWVALTRETSHADAAGA